MNLTIDTDFKFKRNNEVYKYYLDISMKHWSDFF